MKEYTEYLTGWETQDLKTLLMGCRSLFESMAAFSSVRRDVKAKCQKQVEEIDFWMRRNKKTLRIDAGLILGLQHIKEETDMSFDQTLQLILEYGLTAYAKKGGK